MWSKGRANNKDLMDGAISHDRNARGLVFARQRRKVGPDFKQFDSDKVKGVQVSQDPKDVIVSR